MRAQFLVPLLALAMLPASQVQAQQFVRESQVDPALADRLAALDAAMFKAAFELCDAKAMRALVTDDFEFYHDRSGLIASNGDDFAAQNEHDCAQRERGERDRLRRELIPGSLTVHALGEGGAMQIGRHRFYLLREGKPDQLIEEATFIHLWRKTDSGWRIAREISYDHLAVKED